MSLPCHKPPTEVDEEKPQVSPGEIREYNGDLYLYSQLVGTAGTVAATEAVYRADDPDEFKVTKIAASAIDNTLGAGNSPEGVAVRSVTTGNYGYFKRTGITQVATTGTVNKGDSLCGPDTVSGVMKACSAGLGHLSVGLALANASGNVVTAELWIS